MAHHAYEKGAWVPRRGAQISGPPLFRTRAVTAYLPLPGARYTGEPWLDPDGILHFAVDAAPPPCLTEGGPARHVANGWRSRTLIGLPLGDRPVRIHIREQRCRTCGARARLAWIDPVHPHYTTDAIAYARRQGLATSFAAAAKALACDESVVRRLCLPAMLHLAHTYRPQAPRLLAIDECHLGRSRKSRRKRLVLVDAEAPRGQGLIELGRSDTDAELCRLLRALEHPERIVAVALDGLQRYADVVRAELPHAAIVYDRMHLQNDVLAIAVAAWRAWHHDNAHHRDPDTRAALQVDADLLTTYPKKLTRGQRAALTALEHVAPHVTALHDWAHQLIRLYLYPVDDAAKVLQTGVSKGRHLLDRHGEALPDVVAKELATLLKRLKARHDDVLGYLRHRIARPTRRDPAREVGLTTSGVESYNRWLKAINAEGNGLHPEVLRVKALVRFGPLIEERIEAAAALARPLLKGAKVEWPKAPAAPPRRTTVRRGRRRAPVRCDRQLQLPLA